MVFSIYSINTQSACYRHIPTWSVIMKQTDSCQWSTTRGNGFPRSSWTLIHLSWYLQYERYLL